MANARAVITITSLPISGQSVAVAYDGLLPSITEQAIITRSNPGEFEGVTTTTGLAAEALRAAIQADYTPTG
jgi:hypothetical protein